MRKLLPYIAAAGVTLGVGTWGVEKMRQENKRAREKAEVALLVGKAANLIGEFSERCGAILDSKISQPLILDGTETVQFPHLEKPDFFEYGKKSRTPDGNGQKCTCLGSHYVKLPSSENPRCQYGEFYKSGEKAPKTVTKDGISLEMVGVESPIPPSTVPDENGDTADYTGKFVVIITKPTSSIRIIMDYANFTASLVETTLRPEHPGNKTKYFDDIPLDDVVSVRTHAQAALRAVELKIAQPMSGGHSNNAEL